MDIKTYKLRLRYNLIDIENKIKCLVETKDFPQENQGERKDNLEKLLRERRKILNEMFIPSEKNLSRLNEINDYLYHLTLNLHARTNQMYEQKLSWFCNPDFDDSYNLEGTLQFVYNGEESVLKLDDDDFYHSDFPFMIELIYNFHYRQNPNIQYFMAKSELLDDGESWNEYPFHDKCFDPIIICHAVHSICNHHLYSIPDLLRLNDFWAEVRVDIQNITDQSGNRFKD